MKTKRKVRGSRKAETTLFFFNKNHFFQNEAGLFLIFFKKWGSIVLNLFLNFIEYFKEKTKKTSQKISSMLFSFDRKLCAQFFDFDLLFI